MNWYHSWIYEYVLNTTWLVGSVVYMIWGVNALSLLILWFVMSPKKIGKKKVK